MIIAAEFSEIVRKATGLLNGAARIERIKKIAKKDLILACKCVQTRFEEEESLVNYLILQCYENTQHPLTDRLIALCELEEFYIAGTLLQEEFTTIADSRVSKFKKMCFDRNRDYRNESFSAILSLLPPDFRSDFFDKLILNNYSLSIHLYNRAFRALDLSYHESNDLIDTIKDQGLEINHETCLHMMQKSPSLKEKRFYYKKAISLVGDATSTTYPKVRIMSEFIKVSNSTVEVEDMIKHCKEIMWSEDKYLKIIKKRNEDLNFVIGKYIGASNDLSEAQLLIEKLYSFEIGSHHAFALAKFFEKHISDLPLAYCLELFQQNFYVKAVPPKYIRRLNKGHHEVRNYKKCTRFLLSHCSTADEIQVVLATANFKSKYLDLNTLSAKSDLLEQEALSDVVKKILRSTRDKEELNKVYLILCKRLPVERAVSLFELLVSEGFLMNVFALNTTLKKILSFEDAVLLFNSGISNKIYPDCYTITIISEKAKTRAEANSALGIYAKWQEYITIDERLKNAITKLYLLNSA